MRVPKISILVALLLTANVVLASGGTGGGGGTTCTCVSLSVSKETAPPGSLTQMKVFVTEPKPISTGGGSITFDTYDSIFGISLSSHSGDSYGFAIVNGNNIKLSVISPSATFASSIDYPILTVVGRVPATASIGTKFPMTLDPNSVQFFDTTGTLYPIDVKQGFLVAGTAVSIGDVSPGSAVLPAGAIVKITGTNFAPGTKFKFAEAGIAQQIFHDSTWIDVVLSTPANMQGMMIKASNPDGTSDVYFSYQRTFPMPVLSADPVMQHAMPLVPPKSVLAATIALPVPVAGTTYGVALQNLIADTTATVMLVNADGTTATTSVDVGLNKFVVREFSELFGTTPAPGATIVVSSPSPIEVLGIAANQTTGTALPIIPQ
jgi:hypothetical protein